MRQLGFEALVMQQLHRVCVFAGLEALKKIFLTLLVEIFVVHQLRTARLLQHVLVFCERHLELFGDLGLVRRLAPLLRRRRRLPRLRDCQPL